MYRVRGVWDNRESGGKAAKQYRRASMALKFCTQMIVSFDSQREREIIG